MPNKSQATAAGGSAEQFIHPTTQWMVVHNLTDEGEFVARVTKAYRLFTEGKLAQYGRTLKETTADDAPAKFRTGFQEIMTQILRQTSEQSMCRMWTPKASIASFLVDIVERSCSCIKLPNTDMDDE